MFISKSNADYVPNLTAAARGGYNLVISVGFLMGDATAAGGQALPEDEVRDHRQLGRRGGARRASRRTSAGCSSRSRRPATSSATSPGSQSKNVPNSSGVIAAVGGLKIPPVDRFIAGYYQGAKAAYPAVKVEHSYSQDFVDQAKCKEAALNHIANGATVVFQVAGQCGLGVLCAAKEKGVFGIGVDADQGYLGNHVLTSATKKVDVAVFKTIEAAKAQWRDVQDELQRHLHREEQRRRLRQDLHADAGLVEEGSRRQSGCRSRPARSRSPQQAPPASG